jgi:hypothetical protein
MKSTILALTIFFISFSAFSKSVTLRRIDALEKKVEELELKIKNLGMKDQSISETIQNGIKVRDGNNEIREVRSISSGKSDNSLSENKKKEIIEKIESYKKNQAESQKILDEIMSEN